MLERRPSEPATGFKTNSKPEGKLLAITETPQGAHGVSAKSTSLRQCKSFNAKDTKVSKCSEASKIAAFTREKVGDPPSILHNGAKPAKSNYSSSKPDAPQLSKPLRQNSIAKADSAQPAPIRSAKDTSPKPANPLAQVSSLSSSVISDPQKKLPPIKTSRTSSSKSPSTARNTANLCSECKAEAEGAVCFIGNDGRVSACSSRNAIRLCKNLKCANHNPELVEVNSGAAAASTGPKKYLISRRHSLNLRPRSTPPTGKNEKPALDKLDAQALNGKASSSPQGVLTATGPQHDGNDDLHGCNEFYTKEDLHDDAESPEDLSAKGADIDGTASASPHRGRSNGLYQRMRRRSFNVIETHAPAELVILRKQMMQERKQAEEWMLDYAIEEALQKLVPSKESKVKALVEAFESIMPNKEADAATVEVREHQSVTQKVLSN